ncbi:urease accessory protein UreD [Halioxenophilus aromaticivorans]|uniref:urease accessory protein UreD n=1 Tax=Halioxenophilus aromaticivorans TaxID=1306992 RepID=UPI0031E7E565
MGISQNAPEDIDQQSVLSDQRKSTFTSALKWPANLSLAVVKTARGTRLAERSHSGPLYVQKPFYPEGPDHAHIYLLHPPGGVVSGDSLDITINVKSKARALFTTPGAGRIYRARPDLTPQVQTVTITLDQQAVTEWLPLETIVYPASRGVLRTSIKLPEDNSASFLGWEITCLGLPASQLPFSNGQLQQSFELWRKDKPVFIEKLRLDAQDQSLIAGRAGFQGHSVSALMVAGPFADRSQPEISQIKRQTHSEVALNKLVDELRDKIIDSQCVIGVTVKSQFIVIRLLANSSQQARVQLTQAWQVLRPHLTGQLACEPRVWSC